MILKFTLACHYFRVDSDKENRGGIIRPMVVESDSADEFRTPKKTIGKYRKSGCISRTYA